MGEIHRLVSKEFTNDILVGPYGRMMVLYFHGFIIEKIMIDKYFMTKLELPDSLWYNYVIPLRRRLSYINQPEDWRNRRTLKDLNQNAFGGRK